MLPEFEVCGLKMNPMIQKLKSEKSIEIQVEFYSFFKKLTPFTLEELKKKFNEDPKRNFNLRLEQMRKKASA